jgi:alpha-amylase
LNAAFLVLLVSSFPTYGGTPTTSTPISLPRTVMVHLFEWKWKDIAKECREFLGPHGFSAVQVSPPNEHVVLPGQPWYQRYQPVSYKIESRGGTRAEFAMMVHECKAAGVDIYVDAVINHMSAVLPENRDRTGSAGSRYSNFQFPLYSFQDFHHCHRNGDDSIQNYSDRWEVQNCQLVSLADLDTEAPYVQTQIANYLTDLLHMGVAGFRIDAAKHIPSPSIQAILARVPGAPFVYQEVIDQGGEPIKASEYLQNGHVTEFKYGLDLGRIFSGGQLAWLNGTHRFGEGWGYMSTDKAIVFVDNHDNQRGHGGGGHVLTHKDPRLYKLASVLMLAWPYGYPQVMSSYAFTSPSQGPPANGDGSTKDAVCLNPEEITTAKTGWVCEHRWPTIANMAEFRNWTDRDFKLTNWWTNGNNQIAFGRGNSGFAVMNNEDQGMDQVLQTGLEPGIYCNAATDRYVADACEQVRVNSNGTAHFVVPPRAAVAIHIGAWKPLAKFNQQ